jgi:hypothetical protein
MPRTSRQILIFRVVRWIHGSNIVRLFFSRPLYSRLFFPRLRLPTRRFPQHCSWICPIARRIPRFGGEYRFATFLNHSVSPIQYAFDDFTISQVAKMLGNRPDAAKVSIPLAEAFSNLFIICGAVCLESWILCKQLESQRDRA